MDQNKKAIIPSQPNIFQDAAIRAKLILRLMADGRVSIFTKLIPLASLAYLISPVDFIPNAIAPILGTLDDAAILWLGSYIFLEACPTEVVRAHIKALVSNNEVVEEEKRAAQSEEPEEVIDATFTEEK
jgi:uncharacterized membrane protein YkvA (DUF1232 family)